MQILTDATTDIIVEKIEKKREVTASIHVLRGFPHIVYRKPRSIYLDKPPTLLDAKMIEEGVLENSKDYVIIHMAPGTSINLPKNKPGSIIRSSITQKHVKNIQILTTPPYSNREYWTGDEAEVDFGDRSGKLQRSIFDARNGGRKNDFYSAGISGR